MVEPANSLNPSHCLGIFPELNTQCREINRHSTGKNPFGCVFWSILLVVCVLTFGLQSFILIRRFLDYDTVQSIREKGAVELHFPDVLICPLNAVNITKMKAEGLDNDSIMYLLSAFDRSFIPVGHVIQFSPMYQKWLRLHNNPNVQNLEQTLMHFALDPRLMTTFCEVQGLTQDCVIENEDFSQYLSRDGICSVMKPKIKLDNGSWDEPLQQVPGFTGAWLFSLTRTEFAKTPFLPTLLDSYLVHLNKELPIGDLEALTTDPIVVTPGVLAMIAIKERRIHRLHYPYADAECFNHEDAEAYFAANRSMIRDSNYSSELCYRDCQANHSMHVCNATCVLPGHFGPHRHDIRICETELEYTCVRMNARKAKCNHCRKICEYVTWSYTVSNVIIKDPEFSMLYVYHSDMTYLEVMDKASSPFTSLVGDIGGQLSLWLGFKVATVVQILYYLVFWTIGGCCWGEQVTPVAAIHDEKRISLVMPD